MWIRVTEWLTVTQLAVGYGSGQKKAVFPSVQYDYFEVTSFFLQVVGRKFHTEIFVSPSSERCWHGLGISHDYL
jgi:hypothetical protein